MGTCTAKSTKKGFVHSLISCGLVENKTIYGSTRGLLIWGNKQLFKNFFLHFFLQCVEFTLNFEARDGYIDRHVIITIWKTRLSQSFQE